MVSSPEFVFDEDSKTIHIKTGDAKVKLYSDVTKSEFELVKEIDEFVTEGSSLLDVLLSSMKNQGTLIQNGDYFTQLDRLQQAAAEYYNDCIELRNQSQNSDSSIIKEQLGTLYKLEKFLKHYLRCLSVAQSTGFSQQLVLNYLGTGNHIFLYGFVRNTCSTIEYLGKLIENRIGQGDLGLHDKSVNCVDVYEELKRQGLTQTLGEDQEIQIPPTGETKRMGDVTLETSSMRFLWEKRNEIVHQCPLVVSDETSEQLPEDIQSTCTLTTTDVERLLHLSYRLHMQSVGIFISFSSDYIKNILTETIDAWMAESG